MGLHVGYVKLSNKCGLENNKHLHSIKYDYKKDLRFMIQLKKNESEEVSTAWKRFSCFVFITSQFRIDLRRILPSFELLVSWLNMFASSMIKMEGLL